MLDAISLALYSHKHREQNSQQRKMAVIFCSLSTSFKKGRRWWMKFIRNMKRIERDEE
jgi:hypothetical protein